MENLKLSHFFILLALFGCSKYKVNINHKTRVEIIATPDRVLPFCEKVIQDDKTVSYGFMILFLDEEKTVGAATGMLTTPSDCFEWRSEVQNILDNGKEIKIQGSGNILEPRVEEVYSHTFKGHGTYKGNGRSIDLFSIRNNLGECFTNYEGRCSD